MLFWFTAKLNGYHILGDSIPPGFQGTIPVLRVLTSCVPVYRIIRLGTPNVSRFPSHKKHFRRGVHTFWLSHGGRKHLQEWDSHQPATSRRGEEDVIAETGLTQRRVGKAHVEENRRVNWLSVWIWVVIIILLLLLLLLHFCILDRDSVVGVATCYGLHGPEFEFR